MTQEQLNNSIEFIEAWQVKNFDRAYDLVLNHGADINYRNEGMCALHMSCSRCEPEQVKWLVENGASVWCNSEECSTSCFGRKGLVPSEACLESSYIMNLSLGTSDVDRMKISLYLREVEELEEDHKRNRRKKRS